MKISDIRLNPNNPRIIKDKKFKKLCRSIEQFPYMLELRPIVIDETGLILGGNMRYRALKELKMEIKPEWVKVGVLTEEEKRRFTLEDNVGFGEWDWDQLANEWSDLPLDDWGISTNPWIPDNPLNNPMLEMARISSLKPNPRSYREHPADQIEHLVKSIQNNGIYRNIIIAKDGTILDGHALVKAAEKVGLKEVPVMRLDIEADSEEALKILVSNNEIGKFAEVDDRKLTDLLKELKNKNPDGLGGTGFDEMMLANLAMLTRPAGEIKDLNEAAEWLGMPDFQMFSNPLKMIVSFDSLEDRTAFAKQIGQVFTDKTKSIWYPYKEMDDTKSIKFE
jgi:ParB-like chromosome segregation protein Spo0J